MSDHSSRDEQIDFNRRASTAPPHSLWAEQEGADFFLPPALTIDPLTFLDPDATDPKRALRQRFGLE